MESRMRGDDCEQRAVGGSSKLAAAPRPGGGRRRGWSLSPPELCEPWDLPTSHCAEAGTFASDPKKQPLEFPHPMSLCPVEINFPLGHLWAWGLAGPGPELNHHRAVRGSANTVPPPGLCQPGCGLNSHSDCGEAVGDGLPHSDTPCSLPPAPRGSRRSTVCVLRLGGVAHLDLGWALSNRV